MKIQWKLQLMLLFFGSTVLTSCWFFGMPPPLPAPVAALYYRNINNQDLLDSMTMNHFDKYSFVFNWVYPDGTVGQQPARVEKHTYDPKIPILPSGHYIPVYVLVFKDVKSNVGVPFINRTMTVFLKYETNRIDTLTYTFAGDNVNSEIINFTVNKKSISPPNNMKSYPQFTNFPAIIYK